MAKKDFTKNNPALAFISTGQEDTKSQEADKKEAAAAKKTTTKKTTAKTPATRKAPGTPPPGYKVNPQFIEMKTQRINVLLQPSVSDRLKKLAKHNKTSVNETINQAIIEKLEREGF
jgi:hypothetical protein